MNLHGIWMSDKWKDLNNQREHYQKTGPEKGFRDDLMKYADFIALDYQKLGITTRLTMNAAGDIDLTLGTDTDHFGFLEVHKILKIDSGIDMGTASPMIRKHLVTIAGIFMLLNKYGYIKDYVPNELFLEQLGEKAVQDAQTELMNLQLI